MSSMRPIRVAASFARLGIIALLTRAAHVSSAEEAGPAYERNGSYVYGSVAGALEAFDDSGGTTEDGAWGASGGWGYRAHPNFSVEIGFTWLDELNKREDSSSGIDTIVTESVDIWLIMGNLQYIFPMGRFQPYVRGGLGVMQANFKGTGVGRELGLNTSVGGGADLYLTEKLALNANADYMVPLGDSVDDLQMGLFSAGLKYRF